MRKYEVILTNGHKVIVNAQNREDLNGKLLAMKILDRVEKVKEKQGD